MHRTEISAPESLQSVAGKAQCSREFPSMNTAWREVFEHEEEYTDEYGD